MAIPVIRVEFDAKPWQAGEFVLDTSALDGADTLATSPRWVDVSTLDDAVITGRITQGRQNVDNPVQAGTCVLTCDNFTGNYDPDQMPGVFYPYLLKGMLCRVSAIIGGTPYGLFTGRLDDAQVSKGYDLAATLTFVDDPRSPAIPDDVLRQFGTSVHPVPHDMADQHAVPQPDADLLVGDLTVNLLPTLRRRSSTCSARWSGEQRHCSLMTPGC